MIKKTLIIVLSILLLFSSFVTNASVVSNDRSIDKSSGNIIKSNLMSSPIYVPEWSNDDYWKYDSRFVFDAYDKNDGRTLHLDGLIKNLKATVIDIKVKNGVEQYVLDLDGRCLGEVSLLGAFNLGDLDANFGGKAYLTTDNLAPTLFKFRIEGSFSLPLVGGLPFLFTMDMGFKPCFNFLDFPIYPDNDEWPVNIEEATLDAYIEMGYFWPIQYSNDYHGSMIFNDYMITKGIEYVTVPAGTYETAKLSGTWGDPSELYYSADAGFLVKLNEVIDWGSRNKITSEFYMDLKDTNHASSNNAPYEPSNPTPSHNSKSEDINVDLSWSGGDPEDDPVEYDIYFAKNNDPSYIATTSKTSYDLSTLEYDQEYFWKIVARDDNGNTIDGPLWTFSTKKEPTDNMPPYKPSNPSPFDGANKCFIAMNLGWDGGDPDGDTVTYDVYLGKNKPLIEDDLLIRNIEYDSWFSGILDKNTQYYWKVVAYDDKGQTTEGDTWEFKTMKSLPENEIPSTPVITGPQKIKSGENKEYNIVSEDQEDDEIYYVIITFCDGRIVNEPIVVVGNSGETVSFNYKPLLTGEYIFKAHATDNPNIEDRWSEWGQFRFSCPKTKTQNKIFNFLSLFRLKKYLF